MSDILEKIQPYLSMDYSWPNDEEPLFDLSFNTDDTSFKIIQLYEVELRALIHDIETQLDLYLQAFEDHVRGSDTTVKGGEE